MKLAVRLVVMAVALLAVVAVGGGTATAATPAPLALNTNATSDLGKDTRPQVTTDGGGNWVAVWMSTENLLDANLGIIGTDSDILVSRSTDNGATWSDPGALNTNAAADSRADQTPQVTTDGQGNWLAVWDSSENLVDANLGPIGTDFDILVSRSTDNGVSWTPPVALNVNAATDSEGDLFAQLTTDGQGNWVAVWRSQENLNDANLGFIGTDFDILAANSTTLGTWPWTWSAPAALNTNAAGDSLFDVAPQVTTNGTGDWVAVWFSNEDVNTVNLGPIGNDTDILVARSIDNGVSWTAPAALNTNAVGVSGSDIAPQVTTDGTGNWVAVWTSSENVGGIGTDDDILVARSTNNGLNWTAPAALNTNATTDLGRDLFPQVTTDGTGNWVAVWASSDTLGGIGTDDDILVARSTSNGVSWTPPVALYTSAGTDTGQDSRPQVTTNGAGNWVTVWDSTEDLLDANLGGTIGTDFDILYTNCSPSPQATDSDADGLSDTFEAGFLEEGVKITNPETCDTASATGSAGGGSTITSGSISVTFPPGTKVLGAGKELEIRFFPGPPPKLEIENADLPTTTRKTVEMPIDSGTFVCIDDRPAAEIEAVGCNPPREEIAIPALGDPPNTLTATTQSGVLTTYTVTRISPDKIEIKGLVHTVIAIVPTAVAVGGTTEHIVDGADSPASASDGSSVPYAVAGSAAAAALAVVAAGGWYARRRFLR